MHSPPPSLDDRRMPLPSQVSTLMLALVETTLVIIIMSNDNDVSKASMQLGFLGLRESMTPVGGYESSWRHINLRPFQPFSTRNITRLGRTHAAPNVRTKSTLHVFTFREDLRYFSDAGSVSGQLIDSDHRAVKASLRSLVPPKNKKKLKNDRKRFMRLDYAILQQEEGRDELARRALEILESKLDDTILIRMNPSRTLYTEQRKRFCQNVLEQNHYGIMVLLECLGSSRIDEFAEQRVRRLSYQTTIKITPFCAANCSRNTPMCHQKSKIRLDFQAAGSCQ